MFLSDLVKLFLFLSRSAFKIFSERWDAFVDLFVCEEQRIVDVRWKIKTSVVDEPVKQVQVLIKLIEVGIFSGLHDQHCDRAHEQYEKRNEQCCDKHVGIEDGVSDDVVVGYAKHKGHQHPHC